MRNAAGAGTYCATGALCFVLSAVPPRVQSAHPPAAPMAACVSPDKAALPAETGSQNASFSIRMQFAP